MPEFILKDRDRPEYKDLDLFTQGYIEALFFTECNPDADENLQNMGFSDLAPDTLARIVEDCQNFQRLFAGPLERAYSWEGYGENQAGIDFWFTRNRHGCGYWDRDIHVEVKSELTDAAHGFSEVYAYAGDDNQLHVE